MWPLSGDQVKQANEQLASRFQALNPGKSLPPEYQLKDGATVSDYNRASESLKSLESTAGTTEQRKFNQGIAEQNLDIRKQEQGMRQQEQQEKLTKPYHDTLDNIAEAREFAASPSATNDYGLLMDFIGTTKPESLGKIRLNTQELKLAVGTRNSLGDLQALISKVENGQMLTSNQRKQMLGTMDIVEKAVQRRLDAVTGGSKDTNEGARPREQAVYQNGKIIGYTMDGKNMRKP